MISLYNFLNNSKTFNIMSYSMKNQSGQGAKDMKRVKFGLSTKITACILTVQIIVMAAMVLFIGNAITNDTRRSTTNSMELSLIHI